MITLEGPHMALNSVDFTERYQMWNSWNDIDSSTTREHIVQWVAAVARRAPGGKLKNLVINSHGSPGRLIIGEGFGAGDVKMFSAWIGLVDKVWMNACSIGRITPGADGNMFLFNMATEGHFHVVASTETQYTTRGRIYPYGQIDTFEGLLLSYTPGMGVTWSRRYSSSWQGE